jgi:FkbM family methyltransferase
MDTWTGVAPLMPPELRRARLLAWKDVDTVIDVGANVGQFGTRIREAGYRGRIISFEPLARAFAGLAAATDGDPRWDCHRLALGARAGHETLHVSADLEASSILAMEDRHVRHWPPSAYVGAEAVEVVALDAVAPSLLPERGRLYVKLDVQGYELEVLRGAEEVLARAELLEAELSLVPLYRGGPLYREVLDHIERRGFELVSVEGITEEPETGHMLQVDAVLARAPGARR